MMWALFITLVTEFRSMEKTIYYQQNQNFDEEWKIEEYAINVNRIMKYLTALTDQVNILILDACRNNPWEGSFRSVGGSNNGGLAKIPAPTGSLIAFSTDAGTSCVRWRWR